jgi:hypothetical protein
MPPMPLLARFDTLALRPPSPSKADVPAELLAWCRDSPAPFAWRETDALLPVLDALMRELDGDRLLGTLSPAAGWAWRLSLKAREARGGRRPGDPWDAGHLQSLEALQPFRPRRPTLIVSADPRSKALLAARADVFAWPVRLLLASGGA